MYDIMCLLSWGRRETLFVCAMYDDFAASPAMAQGRSLLNINNILHFPFIPPPLFSSRRPLSQVVIVRKGEIVEHAVSRFLRPLSMM